MLPCDPRVILYIPHSNLASLCFFFFRLLLRHEQRCVPFCTMSPFLFFRPHAAEALSTCPQPSLPRHHHQHPSDLSARTHCISLQRGTDLLRRAVGTDPSVARKGRRDVMARKCAPNAARNAETEGREDAAAEKEHKGGRGGGGKRKRGRAESGTEGRDESPGREEKCKRAGKCSERRAETVAKKKTRKRKSWGGSNACKLLQAEPRNTRTCKASVCKRSGTEVGGGSRAKKRGTNVVPWVAEGVKKKTQNGAGRGSKRRASRGRAASANSTWREQAQRSPLNRRQATLVAACRPRRQRTVSMGQQIRWAARRAREENQTRGNKSYECTNERTKEFGHRRVRGDAERRCAEVQRRATRQTAERSPSTCPLRARSASSPTLAPHCVVGCQKTRGGRSSETAESLGC